MEHHVEMAVAEAEIVAGRSHPPRGRPWAPQHPTAVSSEMSEKGSEEAQPSRPAKMGPPNFLESLGRPNAAVRGWKRVAKLC